MVSVGKSLIEQPNSYHLYPSRLSDRSYILDLIRRRIESIAQTYLIDREGLVLVDLGCGSCPYKPIFEQYVAQYVAVDLPENPKADFFVSENNYTTLHSNFADVVLSTQVLEHSSNPMKYLRECYRILKPGGLIFLSTHGYWIYHPDPADFWRWTRSGLTKIIEESGFQVVESQGIMGLAPTALQLFQDALRPKIPGFIKPLFVLMAQLFIALLDRLHSQSERDQDACVLVVVASKAESNPLESADS
jgi:SAM-dependent methyltransferase